MDTDFPVITKITEAASCESAAVRLRLDVCTESGQRYIWLSGDAAHELLETLQASLRPATIAERFPV